MILSWLHKNLKKGIYIPFLKSFLTALEKVSLNFWVKKYCRNRGFTNEAGDKCAPWVSEIYQIVFLTVGAIIIFSTPISYYDYLSCIIILLLGYRLFEIIVFTGNWIFPDKDIEIHSIHRSFAGFSLNIIELALYVSIISTLIDCNCETPTTFKNHLKGIITLDIPEMNQHLRCQILWTGEFALSILLILVVIAALVGGIVRKEIKEEQPRS